MSEALEGNVKPSFEERRRHWGGGTVSAFRPEKLKEFGKLWVVGIEGEENWMSEMDCVESVVVDAGGFGLLFCGCEHHLIFKHRYPSCVSCSSGGTLACSWHLQEFCNKHKKGRCIPSASPTRKWICIKWKQAEANPIPAADKQEQFTQYS